MNRWWLNENWRGRSFTWDLWYGCNYRCSYCWWEMTGAWTSLAKQHRILPPEKWCEAWERIYRAGGEVRIDVIGGEPLFYPSSLELFCGLCRRHRVSITTNLSVSMDYLQSMAGKTSPDRLHLGASFHPQFARWDEFAAKIVFLKEAGFEPFVNMVAWPPFLEDLPKTREAIQAWGVPVTTQVFQGVFEGKEYPGAYSPGQRRFLNMAIPDADEITYRLEQGRTKGKLCGAGHVYANINGDGEVYRCGQDSRANQFGAGPSLGNILDENFQLSPEPKPCPYEHCSCGEFVFLWESWGRARGFNEK
ncbi:MAG: radical SAM protein [Elusimicrobiota bacterium]